jgi:hypothetical protein
VPRASAAPDSPRVPAAGWRWHSSAAASAGAARPYHSPPASERRARGRGGRNRRCWVAGPCWCPAAGSRGWPGAGPPRAVRHRPGRDRRPARLRSPVRQERGQPPAREAPAQRRAGPAATQATDREQRARRPRGAREAVRERLDRPAPSSLLPTAQRAFPRPRRPLSRPSPRCRFAPELPSASWTESRLTNASV